MQKYKFKDYREEKPPEKGWYVWRLPHKEFTDLSIVFLDKYRERGAGYENVLSPGFDYWNGYSVLLPKGPIEWAEYDGEEPKPGNEIIEIVGVENAPCPFCKQVPEWRYKGRHITARPIDTDYFYVTCCEWVNKYGKSFEDPRKLAETRNNLLLPKTDQRQTSDH